MTDGDKYFKYFSQVLIEPNNQNRNHTTHFKKRQLPVTDSKEIPFTKIILGEFFNFCFILCLIIYVIFKLIK